MNIPINLNILTSSSQAFCETKKDRIIDTLFRTVPATFSEVALQTICLSGFVFVFAGGRE